MAYPNQREKILDAKAVDIVNLLIERGHYPTKQNEREVWFHSPVNAENTPSFRVSLHDNRFHDRSGGREVNGDSIDLIQMVDNLNFKDALNYLTNGTVFEHNTAESIKKKERYLKEIPKPHQKILEIKNSVEHPKLIQYLESKGLDSAKASNVLQEVHYEVEIQRGNKKFLKTYFALGMKNHKGGYELTNTTGKYVIDTKGFTFFEGGTQKSGVKNDKCLIFEGMTDYLSALEHSSTTHLHTNTNVLILNSITQAHEGIAHLKTQGIKQLYIYMDNDQPGNTITEEIIDMAKSLKMKAHDKSHIYKGYKDYNEYYQRMQQTKNNQKQEVTQAIKNVETSLHSKESTSELSNQKNYPNPEQITPQPDQEPQWKKTFEGDISKEAQATKPPFVNKTNKTESVLPDKEFQYEQKTEDIFAKQKEAFQENVENLKAKIKRHFITKEFGFDISAKQNIEAFRFDTVKLLKEQHGLHRNFVEALMNQRDLSFKNAEDYIQKTKDHPLIGKGQVYKDIAHKYLTKAVQLTPEKIEAFQKIIDTETLQSLQTLTGNIYTKSNIAQLEADLDAILSKDKVIEKALLLKSAEKQEPFSINEINQLLVSKSSWLQSAQAHFLLKENEKNKSYQLSFQETNEQQQHSQEINPPQSHTEITTNLSDAPTHPSQEHLSSATEQPKSEHTRPPNKKIANETISSLRKEGEIRPETLERINRERKRTPKSNQEQITHLDNIEKYYRSGQQKPLAEEYIKVPESTNHDELESKIKALTQPNSKEILSQLLEVEKKNLAKIEENYEKNLKDLAQFERKLKKSGGRKGFGVLTEKTNWEMLMRNPKTETHQIIGEKNYNKLVDTFPILKSNETLKGLIHQNFKTKTERNKSIYETIQIKEGLSNNFKQYVQKMPFTLALNTTQKHKSQMDWEYKTAIQKTYTQVNNYKFVQSILKMANPIEKALMQKEFVFQIENKLNDMAYQEDLKKLDAKKELIPIGNTEPLIATQKTKEGEKIAEKTIEHIKDKMAQSAEHSVKNFQDYSEPFISQEIISQKMAKQFQKVSVPPGISQVKETKEQKIKI